MIFKKKKEKTESNEIKEEIINQKEIVQENVSFETKEQEYPLFEFEDVNEDGLQNKVEEERIKFMTIYKKRRTISNISTLVCTVLLVVGLVFMVSKTQVLNFVGYGVVGATVVAMFAFFVIGKNKLPHATNDYIKFVNATYNNFLYQDKVFSKVSIDPNEKLEMQTFLSDKVYKDMSSINTRNVVKATYKKKDKIMIADTALYVKDKKADKVCFLGKYISSYNKLKIEDRVIITLKGEKPCDLPTDVEELKEFQYKGLTCFAKDEKYEKSIGTDVLDAIDAFNHTKHLLNLNIVLWEGHTGIYMSYDDITMTFPFKTAFDKEAIVNFKKEMLDILNILNTLN